MLSPAATHGGELAPLEAPNEPAHGEPPPRPEAPGGRDSEAAPMPQADQPGEGTGANSTYFRSYVLYVAPRANGRGPEEKCRGSQAALALIEAFREDVDVQDVSELQQRGDELPPWLDGTPCVVDTARKLAFKGSDAIEHLRRHSDRGIMTLGGLDGVEADASGGDSAALDYSTAPKAGGVPSVQSGRPNVVRESKLDGDALQRLIEQRLGASAVV